MHIIDTTFDMIKYSIKNKFRYTANDIIDESELDLNSMKFLIFEYIIPLPMFPAIKRISKVYVYNKNEINIKAGYKYSIINIIVCWLGLPFGPIDMISAYKKNRNGIDITNEIKPNISIKDLTNGYFILPIYNNKFLEITKPIKTEFQLILNEVKELNLITIGYTRHKRKHYFYASSESKIEEELISDFKREFKNRFNNKSIIEFCTNESDPILYEKLQQEGLIMKNKNDG